MLKLVIPPLLKKEFATVEALWASSGETRRVDSLVLAWVKYEKQLRRLFCFLVYQHPGFSEKSIVDIIDVLVSNRNLYPDTLVRAIEGLGVKKVSSLIGSEYSALASEIDRIKKYRNKLIHGQVTGQSISSAQLERDVKFLVAWIAALAEGAQLQFGYDGLGRNTFRAAKGVTSAAVASYPFSTPAEFKTWLGGLTK
jgi:hypothetical protein